MKRIREVVGEDGDGIEVEFVEQVVGNARPSSRR